ncbi:MAG: RNA helicase [Chitinophagales bacterium]|nr:MAG: RNA helicase [Chitinophagales bacterium]
MTFRDFHFEPELMEGLEAMGFQTPTPIQQKAIPIILSGKDLIACAQTGTGKTAAFLLPVINKLIKRPTEGVNTLIIVPTRELAMQIDQALQGLAYFAPVSSIAIYGGTGGEAFEREKKALVTGVNIVIATPGRLIAHLNMGYVNMNHLEHLILDEADRMLDMGFSEDIYRILKYLPEQRQTLLFSATMPPAIRTLAGKILRQPEQINIAVSKPAAGVIQGAYIVRDAQKPELLRLLLQGKKIDSILIFASTKEKVKQLGRMLSKEGFDIAAMHSDLEQSERNEVLRQFRNKSLQIVVATDVLSRGIDIDSIGLVINYDVPSDAEDYVHRVGRTARASSTGVALTFISEQEQRKFQKIEQLIEMTVRKLPLPPQLGQAPEYNPDKETSRSRQPAGETSKRRSVH